jgi:hypothetical protein
VASPWHSALEAAEKRVEAAEIAAKGGDQGLPTRPLVGSTLHNLCGIRWAASGVQGLPTRPLVGSTLHNLCGIRWAASGVQGLPSAHPPTCRLDVTQLSFRATRWVASVSRSSTQNVGEVPKESVKYPKSRRSTQRVGEVPKESVKYPERRLSTQNVGEVPKESVKYPERRLSTQNAAQVRCVVPEEWTAWAAPG